MGGIASHQPVLRIMAVFSRYPAAIDWAEKTAVDNWGAIALQSERFEFTDTEYYQPSMGDELLKTFFAFEELIDPTELTTAKIDSNNWEDQYRQNSDHAEARPLNLDPGYISLAKLVLATTKDRDHRLYLGKGIYAEVTLHFQARQWQKHPWTYPDYQRPEFQSFFSECREYLKTRRKSI